MLFPTTITLSILSLTVFTFAYHTYSPPASLHFRNLEARSLQHPALYTRFPNDHLYTRSPDDDLYARALYAEGFLHARSLYGRAKASKTEASTAAVPNAAHLKTLRDELASAKSALHTMENNPLQEADGLQVNRLKMKIMNLQGEIMTANGGALK